MCGKIRAGSQVPKKPWAILRHGDPTVVSGREAAARRSLAPAIAAVFDTVGGDVAQRSFAVLKQGRPRRLHCLGRAGAAARTRRRRVAYNASFIF
jgi:hypothetical protein